MKKIIRAKIDAIMSESGATSRFSAAGLMFGLSRLFERLVNVRADWYKKGLLKAHRLPCIVISIGNITSGGAGKTPMTMYAAQLTRRLGYKTVILSRGYKGAAEKSGGIVSDGSRLLMTPQTAGDEPFMMARFLGDIPVLVGKDRVASGRRAIASFSPDIILMDDGFQHLRLHRDINIVLLDAARPLGNTFLLPRGPLREPPEALNRADVLILTRHRDDITAPESVLPEPLRRKPIFRSRHIPYIFERVDPLATPDKTVSNERFRENGLADLKGKGVFAFSAIADNNDFHRILTNLGCRITGTAEFSDHHAYNKGDLEKIADSAVKTGARLLVTTQKDFSKLSRDTTWPLPLLVLGVLPSFKDGNGGFDDFLKNAIEKSAEKDKAPLRILAYLDGRPGHEKQTRGILDALSRLTTVDVIYRAIGPMSMAASLRRWIAYLRPKALSDKKETAPVPVDLIIGTGTHTHMPMLLMKRRTGSKVVTCMSPAMPLLRKFDLCFIPGHDLPKPSRNILVTNGPPNLSETGGEHARDRHLILVGGRDEKSHFWETEKIMAHIRNLIAHSPGISWTISSSPRTPEKTIENLSALAGEQPDVSFCPSRVTPPGWIESAYAKHAVVWVTADSISMIYEALSAGCRVGIIPVRWKHPGNKFQRSIDSLVQNGFAVLSAPGSARFLPPKPPLLDEASRCAREILKRWWPRRLAGHTAVTFAKDER